MSRNTIVPDTKMKVDKRKVADLDLRLYQEAGGQWMIVIGTGQPLLATDCEAQMWRKLLALSEQLDTLRKQGNPMDARARPSPGCRSGSR